MCFLCPHPHSGHGRREIVGNRTTYHIPLVKAQPVVSLATPRDAWCGWDLGDPDPSKPSALPRTLSRARNITVATVIDRTGEAHKNNRRTTVECPREPGACAGRGGTTSGPVLPPPRAVSPQTLNSSRRSPSCQSMGPSLHRISYPRNLSPEWNKVRNTRAWAGEPHNPPSQRALIRRIWPSRATFGDWAPAVSGGGASHSGQGGGTIVRAKFTAAE